MHRHCLTGKMVLRHQRDAVHSCNEEAVGYSTQRGTCRTVATEQIPETHIQRSQTSSQSGKYFLEYGLSITQCVRIWVSDTEELSWGHLFLASY